MLSEQKLIVSARIEVSSVDYIRTGRDCDLRPSAFKIRTAPLIPCTLTYLSVDRLKYRANHVPYSLAHVELDRKAPAAADVAPTAGVPAEVYIKTRSRTALQYLFEPITVFLRHSIQDTCGGAAIGTLAAAQLPCAQEGDGGNLRQKPGQGDRRRSLLGHIAGGWHGQPRSFGRDCVRACRRYSSRTAVSSR